MVETAAAPAGGEETRASGTTTTDLADLQRQLDESRAENAKKDDRIKRLETTTRATVEDAGRRVAEADARRYNAEEQALLNAHAGATTEADTLEAEAAKALEEGRSADWAKITRKLSTAQNRLDYLTGQKELMEANRERAKAAGPGNGAEDPRLKNFSGPVKAWIGDHPEFLSDPTFNADVMSAHYAAVKDGIKLDTPEYFEFIEERVGLREAEAGSTAGGEGEGDSPFSEAGEAEERTEPGAKAAPSGERKRAPQNERRQTSTGRALPPNRSTTTPQQRQQRKAPALTAEQMETARFSFPEEFSKNPADAYQAYSNWLEKTRAEGRLLSQQRG